MEILQIFLTLSPQNSSGVNVKNCVWLAHNSTQINLTNNKGREASPVISLTPVFKKVPFYVNKRLTRWRDQRPELAKTIEKQTNKKKNTYLSWGKANTGVFPSSTMHALLAFLLCDQIHLKHWASMCLCVCVWSPTKNREVLVRAQECPQPENDTMETENTNVTTV